MAKPRPYQDLLIWREAMNLCTDIYTLTNATLPKDECFGLSAQLREKAFGIPMKIVESNVSHSKKARAYLIELAEVSLEGLFSLITLGEMLKYIDSKKTDELRNRIAGLGFLLYKFRTGAAKKEAEKMAAAK
jgi:four helix bundle protein